LRVSAMLKESFTAGQFAEACRKYVAQNGVLRSLARYESPEGIYWDDVKYKGEAYAAYAWAAYVAEVSVDLSTYATKVENFVALQEIGKVIHPILARGQIIGGVAQGIGFAIYEKVLWQNGRMLNGQMTNYIMPASCDLPPIHVVFEELGNRHGAYGAKGIGELPMDGPAPAIINAVVDALGMPFDSIPLLPEDTLEALTVHSMSKREGAPAGASC
jgi:CO/xanthine dehydrogenase Mo-binding subunit